MEESRGRFGEAIASLGADVVVDLICYMPDNAHQFVDALRGRVKRFVRCADVAAALVSAIKRREVSLGQNFHVVSSAALTLQGYAARMAEWFGRSPRMKFMPWQEWRQTVSEKDALATWDHIAHSPNCGIEKAQRLLGYGPGYSSLAAVKESVKWLVAEGAVATS